MDKMLERIHRYADELRDENVSLKAELNARNERSINRRRWLSNRVHPG